MSDCLFCKIIRKEIRSRVEYEDENFMVFYDINPQAPFHVLVIPKKHIEKAGALKEEETGIAGGMIYQARLAAERNGFKDYRLVFNNGQGAGQTVFHIHLHLLAGRPMTWPPG